MSDPQPNGLASLNAQRDRARRSMPAPRHPAIAHDPIQEQVSAEGSPAPAEPPTSTLTPTAEAIQHRSPTPTEMGATFKVTLYVDRDTDEFMEAARVEGLTARPKVDVSRSAVVRLALHRLMDEMSPAEVKALLAGRAVRSTGPGRKRR